VAVDGVVAVGDWDPARARREPPCSTCRQARPNGHKTEGVVDREGTVVGPHQPGVSGRTRCCMTSGGRTIRVSVVGGRSLSMGGLTHDRIYTGVMGGSYKIAEPREDGVDSRE